MNKAAWQRRLALFDELVELTPAAQTDRLATLPVADAVHSDALGRMLADHAAQSEAGDVPPSIAGLRVEDFASDLQAATAAGVAADLPLRPGDTVGAWRLERKFD